MEKYRKFIGKKVVIVLSLLCYLMACIFTPFYYSNMPPTENYLFGSLFCLLLGWAGILFHEGFLKVYFLAWYSNITYVFAIRSLIKVTMFANANAMTTVGRRSLEALRLQPLGKPPQCFS